MHHDKRLFPYKSIQTAFEKARDRAELDNDISFHSLRHHFCSNALISGVPIHLVQKMAGHSSITTTEKYLHIIDSDSAQYMEDYWKSIYRYEEPKKKGKKPSLVSVGGAVVPELVQPQSNISFDTNLIGWDLDKAIANQPIVIDSSGKLKI